jgi:hypothetical protein
VGSGAKIPPQNAIITLTSGPLPKGMDAIQVADAHLQDYAAQGAVIYSVKRGTWKHPRIGDVPSIEIKIPLRPDLVMRQVQCFIAWRDLSRFTCLTFSAADFAFPSQEAQFRKIFETFDPP